MPTTAVQHVKRMRGGAQGHLMRCDDGHYYVVKFRNNPQHERVEAGLQFGSRYVVSPVEGEVFDYLPPEMLDRVRNLGTFAGILALDKWTCNADGRQAAFWRKLREKKYSAAFIDQG